MTKHDITSIRELIEQGWTDDQINDTFRAAEAEEADMDDFHERAFGDMDRDDYSYGENEYNDRLSMGRNDAGEWLGFM